MVDQIFHAQAHGLRGTRSGCRQHVSQNAERTIACISFGDKLEDVAAKGDKRITNRDAWEVGLEMLPDTNEPRNVILSDVG